MNIHCIGTQDAILSHLAELLKTQGNIITGSCDGGCDPQLTINKDLYSKYSTDNINKNINRIIIGPNIEYNNVEIQESIRLGIPISSYIEEIRNQVPHQQRILILGESANNVSALTISVLKSLGIGSDYVLATQNPSITHQVHFAKNPIIIIEGTFEKTEYSKMKVQCLIYDHHIGLICDNSSSYTNHEKDLEIFADNTPRGGSLIFYKKNKIAKNICNETRTDVKATSYEDYDDTISRNGIEYLILPNGNTIECNHIITPHNVEAVRCLLENFAITDEEYYSILPKAIETFLF